MGHILGLDLWIIMVVITTKEKTEKHKNKINKTTFLIKLSHRSQQVDNLDLEC